jgi:hypothetical protein
MVVAAAACDSLRMPIDYGPLAVTSADTQVVNAALGGTGILTIGEQCVVLDTDDGRLVTLAFRAGQVEWNSSTHDVLFQDPFAGSMILDDGASIEVGGADIDLELGGPEPAVRRWIARPNESCPAELFEVHTVKPIG